MHDALQTGNFTVLRDLASDSFRNRYSAAKLAAKFMPRGVAEFDLSAAVLEEPVIMAARQIDGATGVYLSGAVSSNPGAPLFSIAIVPAEGKWALADIVVELRQPIALAAGPSTITPPANDR